MSNPKKQNKKQKEELGAIRQYYNKLVAYAVGAHCCPTPKCKGMFLFEKKRRKERYRCLKCGITGNEKTFVPQIKGDTFLDFRDRHLKTFKDIRLGKRRSKQNYQNSK